MTQQRRFTKEFAEEAVRLVQTSGRTQREIASDLGIGLSTLARWIGRSRDRRHSALDFTSPAQFEKNDRQMSQCLSTIKAGQVHQLAGRKISRKAVRHPQRPQAASRTGYTGRDSCTRLERLFDAPGEGADYAICETTTRLRWLFSPIENGSPSKSYRSSTWITRVLNRLGTDICTITSCQCRNCLRC